MSLVGLSLGHYHLSRLLRAGGMGEVYVADDMKVHRQVAIKVLRRGTAGFASPVATQDALRLFQREAQVIARLDHPHILPLIERNEDVVQGTTVTYIVMPFCPEGALDGWLQQPGNTPPLSPERVASIVQQAADALQYAHDRQIIHRDVKPANFLVHGQKNGSFPELRLADFGIASITSPTAITSIGIVLGSSLYMAPEQWNGSAVAATDQYALAVMAYELLTGRPPFQGNQYELYNHHFQTPAPPPSQWNARLSKKIDAVLLKALAKSPEDRYPAVSAFAQAFQDAVSEKVLIPTIPALKMPIQRLRIQFPTNALQVIILLLSILGILLSFVSPFIPTSQDGYQSFVQGTYLVFTGLGILLLCLLLVCIQTLLLGKWKWSLGFLMLGPLAGVIYALVAPSLITNGLQKQRTLHTRKRSTRSIFFLRIGLIPLIIVELYIQFIIGAVTSVGDFYIIAGKSTNVLLNNNRTLPTYLTNYYNPRLKLIFFDSLTSTSGIAFPDLGILPANIHAWFPYSGTSCFSTSAGLDVSSSQGTSYCSYDSNTYFPYLYSGGIKQFSDIIFEVSVSIRENGIGGIIFREQGQDSVMGGILFITRGGNYGFKLCDPCDAKTILSSSNHSNVIKINYLESNTIDVVMQEKHMEFYVNGQRLLVRDDIGFDAGAIGLLASTGEADYTNARLWTWDPI